MATKSEELVCKYCNKTFRRAASLAVHVCEQKKRFQEENEVGVQIGLRAYLRFYEVAQGSAKLKTFADFAGSPYYRAFVKFGRHCVAIRAINVPRFIDWILKQNKKLDYWSSDAVYTEFLEQHLRDEAVSDALTRAIEESIAWAEETGGSANDLLRYGSINRICYLISTGRISPWVLYNSDSGMQFLNNLTQEQVTMLWSIIDTDFWTGKFHKYRADQEYAREILRQAGW